MPPPGSRSCAPSTRMRRVAGARAGMTTGRRGRGGMMIVRAGLMTVTGRHALGGTTMRRGAGARAGMMADRRARVVMMTAPPGRAGMMTGRGGLMIVTGRRARAGMTTGRPGPVAMTTGRPGRAGTMTGRAGLMIVTGRHARVAMTTGRPGRAGTMTGRAGSIAMTAVTIGRAVMTTVLSGRRGNPAPRRSAVRRRFGAAQVVVVPTWSRRARPSAPPRCGWTRVHQRVRDDSRRVPGRSPRAVRRRAAARRCAHSTR